MFGRTGAAVAAGVLLVASGCGSSGERAVPADGGVEVGLDLAPADLRPLDLASDSADAAPASLLASDRAGIHFGIFYLGCPRASATILVTNRGTAPSPPLLVSLDRPFRIGLDECSGASLDLGAKCRVEIQITPEEPGTISGMFQVWSSPTDLVVVPLEVLAEEVVPAFLLAPAALDFEATAVGQSATRTVMVTVPPGFRAVPEVKAAIIGADFTVARDGCLGLALQAGQTCALEIAFRPTGVGPRTAALTVSAPAPCPPFQSQVWLRGIGQ